MTDRLLLDTHIALWLDSGHARLSAATRELIEDCRQRDGTIYLSAVSAWEIALLVDAGRIDLDLPADAWVERFVGQAGIEPLPLDHRSAVRSCQLPHLEHRDPADRLLIATAIELGCPLVTYDERIARFGRNHGSRYGFTATA